MPRITVNPTISYEPHFVQQFYFEDGTAIFGCVGDPDGVIAANMRSFALSDNGNTYYKTVDDVGGDKTQGWVANGGGGGTGTVTSVDLAMPSMFGVSGNPITTSGTITVTLNNQTANRIFAGPSTGVPAVPTFRALVAADLPAGTGTVTSVDLAMPSIFGVSGNPITTSGTITVALSNQTANRIFAGPSTGVPAVPTFRALVAADIPALAALPANGVQYNDGTNGFAASTNFLFDPATASVQVGVAAGINGKLQLRSAVSGSIIHSVDNPAGNYTYIWPNALPATNDLLTVSVSGSTVTLSGVARSAVAGPTINATDGVIPYRSSATAFADSPLTRTSGSLITSAAGIQFPVGSAATPTINFGDANSGFYRNNTSQCTWSVSSTGMLTIGSGIIRSSASGRFGFASSGGSETGDDTSIQRRQAGYIRVANGGSGIGGLLVGNSTATPIGQTHLINGATGVEPLYLEAIASTSVPTVRGVQSSIQSFGFFPSGKLVGGCNIPTANQQFSALGNAKSDVSTIGNVGGGLDNLLSFQIIANALANPGDYAEFDAFGDFAANANNKTLQVVYGATTIFNTGAVAFNGSNWRMNVKIIRTGASAGKSIATFWSNDSTTPFLQEIFITTEAFTSSVTVQFKAESAASATDDIRQFHLESKLTVALTS